MSDVLTGDDIADVGPGVPAANPWSLFVATQRDELRALPDTECHFDEPLAHHTTLRIGGPADALVLPQSSDAMAAVITWAYKHQLPVTVIGGGSNLLVRDRGVRGLVISTRRMNRIDSPAPQTLRANAGALTSKVLRAATDLGLGGAEFLGGVPGTIGGGLIMNAGTYLGEFKDITHEVTSLRLGGVAVAPSRVTRANAACGFAYRQSTLPADEIVLEATFHLQPRDPAEIRATVKALRQRRTEREPKGFASAGSIFKNPPGDFAGRLIEAAGCKGWQEGASLCSPAHANWLVNTGGATAADHLRLIDRVREAVRAMHGVELVLEVKVIGA